VAKRHSVQLPTVRSLTQQVTPTVDTDKDFKFVVRVEDGEVHIGPNNRDCFECEAFEALLEARAVVRGVTDEDA
jgi:hypothetical protein